MAQQDPGILARRYDPEMAILSLFVLTVSALVCLHKDQVGQNLTHFHLHSQSDIYTDGCHLHNISDL